MCTNLVCHMQYDIPLLHTQPSMLTPVNTQEQNMWSSFTFYTLYYETIAYCYFLSIKVMLSIHSECPLC